MSASYDSLFQPLKIGSIEVKNRFLMAPMEGTSILDWFSGHGFRASSHDFYMERAKDGIALMVPGACTLRSPFTDQWLWKNPDEFKPLGPFMDELHSYGSKLFLQLTAGWGRSMVVMPQMEKILDNKKPDMIPNFDNVFVAPDEGAPNVWMPKYKCRALSVAEIKEYVEAYAKTAVLAKAAGIDGIEVHAVHEGYLIDQFTMPYTNHRTDEYGGSFENRYRFAVEVVQAIKAACGEDYPVSLRYSVVSKTKGYNDGAVPGEEFIEVGRNMAESERAIKYLEDAGYDMFNCDNGTYDAWYWAHPPVYMPLNCNLEDVEHIKKFTTKPVYCAGRMQIADAAEAIAAGRIDGLALGRQFLADNAVITKIAENRASEIKPCISCHTGCLAVAYIPYTKMEFPPNMDMFNSGHCALCPRTLSESKYSVVMAKTPKRIAVIGGGIGGMETAIQSAMRGHSVTLYEKSNKLGGIFIAAAAPSFKEKDKELIEWYRAELKRQPVEVRMNTEIRSLSELDADEIVIATGGRPKSLPIPGWEKTINAEDFLTGRKEVGDKVVIIGGGITGCEVAYELALRGKHPVVVEMLGNLMDTIMVPAANSLLLRDLLKFHQIPVFLETKTTQIRDYGVEIETKGAIRELSADSVIVSVGYSEGTSLVGETIPEHVHIIGDAEHISNLKGAIWAANDLVQTF